jgi:hypothetical protein
MFVASRTDKKTFAMKPIYFFGMLVILAVACSPAKQAMKTSAVVSPINTDSTQYDLIINDINFDTWYQLNYSESKDRTNEYYHSKNIVAVGNWNDYYRSGKYINVIDSYIDYQPQIDYGIDVNRKLYWYFKFVHDYYGVKMYW